VKKAGFIYNPRVAAAEALARDLAKTSKSLESAWVCSSWDEDKAREEVPGSELLVSVGGDGTILRTARISCPWQTPILGVNMGKLGFLTEVSPADALKRMPDFIAGAGWVEERAMLEAELAPRQSRSTAQTFHALNELVLARGASCRVITVKTSVNGELLRYYKADGVIVATATGSTGYALAAGGPILDPQAKELVLKAVAPHLTLDAGLVLPATVQIELELQSDLALLSLDGQVDLPLKGGDRIKLKRSKHVTRFLRTGSPMYFYGRLQESLTRPNGV